MLPLLKKPAFSKKNKEQKRFLFFVVVLDKLDLCKDAVEAGPCAPTKKAQYTSYTPDFFSGKRKSTPEK